MPKHCTSGPPLTVAEAWASYQARVIPRGAHINQVIETRRAFYAGAYAMAQFMEALARPGLDDDQAAGQLAGLMGELAEFVARVRRREA